MTITVAALKRAITETLEQLGPDASADARSLGNVIHSPTALTILAERLSVRPDSGPVRYRTGMTEGEARALDTADEERERAYLVHGLREEDIP